MAKPGLLLIRGLGHSGSTILDLALGAHPQLIGLGEAVRVLERPRLGEEHKGPQQLRGDLRFERRCTCGELAGDCPVWGPLLAWLPAHDDRPLAEKFNRLIEPLTASSPRWLVDCEPGCSIAGSTAASSQAQSCRGACSGARANSS